jgi:hypothetical protein
MRIIKMYFRIVALIQFDPLIRLCKLLYCNTRTELLLNRRRDTRTCFLGFTADIALLSLAVL